MKNIIAKLSIGSYLITGAAILTVIGLILAIISCSPAGFMIVQMPIIVIFSVLTVILVAGAIAFSIWKEENIVSSVIIIGASLLIMFTLFNLIDGKNDVLGTVLFSDLEKGFAPAETACYVGVASMVFYIVAIVTLIVGSFFKVTKTDN